MRTQIVSKNYNISGYLEGEIEEKIKKLEKFFKEDTSVVVTVTGMKSDIKKVDILVNLKNNVLRSEATDRDIRTALDSAADKIKIQLVKNKKKLKNRNNETIRYENIEDTQEDNRIRSIVKNKRFDLTTMTPDEACFQLELLDHSFYVFLNSDTNLVSIVYKRNDGDYGLIEVEK